MQCRVMVLGLDSSDGRSDAVLSTDHPLSSYGSPVLVVAGRAYTAADVVLHGWWVQQVNPPQDGAREVMAAWQSTLWRLRPAR